MKNKFTLEIITALILIALLVLVTDPLSFFMPTLLVKTSAGISIVIFGFLASLFYKENAQDEHEDKQRAFSGRVGFLIGASVLLIGIVFQVFSHAVDSWLVGSLIAMVVGKIGARIFSEYRL